MLNITSNSLCNQLSFNNVQLNIINQNNQIWFTSAELAKALTYKTADSVTRLYNRNKDEFSKNMTMTVKLTANGISNSYRQKSVRIFSLRGAHLVAMLADTDVAKDFRKWLLDLADKEVGNTVTISKIEPEKNCRYEIEITIKDNVFNKAINFNSKATSANAMITGFAKTLGFKIKSMSLVDEPFSSLRGLCNE